MSSQQLFICSVVPCWYLGVGGEQLFTLQFVLLFNYTLFFFTHWVYSYQNKDVPLPLAKPSFIVSRPSKNLGLEIDPTPRPPPQNGNIWVVSQ